MKTKRKIAVIELTTLSQSAPICPSQIGSTNLRSPAGHNFPNRYQDLNDPVLDPC